ncbi:hypothetical protein IEQ34_010903 [Dendrobium chrysotoxum]|uniref:Glycosyl hydrolase family 13 catalytic domain-containing protein n=1 Tax=Dendrobium chrysotoxum TaxID=161865 RepID=A0AAV7GVY1_DENCH|nr:hypothetical protein IEQ34_010903 [Dendrobium chrysotoxum]
MGSLCFPSHGVKSIVSTRTSNASHGFNSPYGSRSPFELGMGEINLANRFIGRVYNQGIEGSVLEEKDSEMLEIGLPLKYFVGRAHPLGASVVDGGINFALFSQHASSVILCISISERNGVVKLLKSKIEVPLDPQKNKTGDIWHICVEGLPDSDVLYGYRVDGPRGWDQGHRFDINTILLDPYAKLVSGRKIFGDVEQRMSEILGIYDFNSAPFDWGPNYKLPDLPETDLVIYEMNVRSFTADESSGLDPEIRGSYLGVISKIPHLLELGVNAVELLPVFEFDELEFQRHPNPRDHLINTWGYSTMNFFAPMSRYATTGAGPLVASQEFKEMVKAFHNAGIEVILDVVYNHTNEADDNHPYTTSFRGIDNKVYYMMDLQKNAELLNYSGCEYHVNGFRFDLASVLCRGTDGTALNAPPIIKAIAKDAVLSKCKIIAEPWDCGGLYLVGRFPNWDRWAEWNGKYRDDIRRFIKGDTGMKGSFATRVSGSADLYKVNQRKPYHSVNFVIAHDGFTLYDLVSYNSKHNDANGENGNDGCNDNFSWNCGFEGETDDINIRNLRARQMKNFHVALMISQGTPMMLMGDEYGHTRHGNNNSYGHDTSINHFQWGELEAKRDSLFRFFSGMIKFRRTHPILRRDRFLKENDVTWHEDSWDNPDSRLHDNNNSGGDIYVAFNAHDYFAKIAVPSPPNGKRWHRVVDTNLESPKDFVSEGVLFNGSVYNMAPYSSIILEAKSFQLQLPSLLLFSLLILI